MLVRPALLVIAALSFSCAPSGQQGEIAKCILGTTLQCICVDGSLGAQACTQTGVFGTCSCTNADAGGDLSSDTPSGPGLDAGPDAPANDTTVQPETADTTVQPETTGAPCLVVTPASVNFGGKSIGKQAFVDVELQNCGDAPLTVSEIRLLNDSEHPGTILSTDFLLELGGLANVPIGTTAFTGPDEPLVLSPNEVAVFQVIFTPDVENPLGADGEPLLDRGIIKIVSNALVPEREVHVTGFGTVTQCPTAVIQTQEGDEVIPQTLLHLIGSQSYGPNGVTKYEWTVLAPSGSASTFLPSAAAPNPTFELNTAGTYLFGLKVWDADSNESCLAAEFQIVVVPDEAIHIEVLWTTPADPDETDSGLGAGADLDLHFAHPFAVGGVAGTNEPWFHDVYDCFWFNEAPDWGGSSSDDDPSLNRDDIDGAGPEILSLNVAESGLEYRVGIHYANDHGYGASVATIRVYVFGVLAFQVEGPELVEGDLWDAARFMWPSGQVTAVAGSNDGFKVISEYPNPLLP